MREIRKGKSIEIERGEREKRDRGERIEIGIEDI